VGTGGISERILGESECSVDDSEESESAKSFCINRKKARKKFFNWERLYYGSSVRSCYFFVFFFVLDFLFFLAQPNVFFEVNENTGLNRKNRYEREYTEKSYKPWEIMLFPSVFF